MPVFRIDLGYDGSGFHGYARNHGVRTIQGELESALERILGAPIESAVAGRTDAGVHARHQVASFETEQAADPERLEKSLRSLLAPEIAVQSVAVADAGFHARFSARARRYCYFVDTGVPPDPLQRHRRWSMPGPIDVSAMQQAAAAFVGTHDFASFCRAQEGRSTERTVLAAGWKGEDTLARFDVAATAFCHQMVRSMVALCVEVGRGRVASDDVPAILEARDRNAARGAAPPHGLTLWEVEY